MFGFVDTSVETVVDVKVKDDELSDAIYVLYYYEPHEPVQINWLQEKGVYNLIARYYGHHGKAIAKEIEKNDGKLPKIKGL